MKIFTKILKEHFSNLSLIFKMAKIDIKRTYADAIFGIFWAFLQPAMICAVYYFAIVEGLKVEQNINGYSYFYWLIAGLIPWFYMKDAMNFNVGCFRRYKDLVIKIKFPISIIPTSINLSKLLLNLFLFGIMIVIFILGGHNPDIYWLEIPFYMFLAFAFFSIFGLFSGLLGAVSGDFANFMRTITTALFWISGIIYNISNLNNEVLKSILSFNPIAILIDGFRKALIYKEWFWQDCESLLKLAIIYIILAILTLFFYKKLYKKIPDYL